MIIKLYHFNPFFISVNHFLIFFDEFVEIFYFFGVDGLKISSLRDACFELLKIFCEISISVLTRCLW